MLRVEASRVIRIYTADYGVSKFLLVLHRKTLSCTVSEIFNVEYWLAFEIWVRVSHWKWHNSIDYIQPIRLPS